VIQEALVFVLYALGVFVVLSSKPDKPTHDAVVVAVAIFWPPLLMIAGLYLCCLKIYEVFK
jgi:hypothetical protein